MFINIACAKIFGVPYETRPLLVKRFFVKSPSESIYLIGKKKVGEKWLDFVQVTKFFPDEIFPRLSFSRPLSFPEFFSPDKEFVPIFFQLLLLLLFFLYICKTYYYHVFFDVLYLSWLSKAVLTKISKCEWKRGIEKNNNNNDIKTKINCTFVNFRNYTTLKTSKGIGFKLVLIIFRSKERVFNSFEDFIWFFDCLCYPR